MTRILSVCICTRDRSDDLRATLASLKESREPIAEIIVSDDGPSDDTKNVAETADIEVLYTVGPRRGLAANRNHALALVSTPYVLFLDDDCRLAPDFLSCALPCMKAYERRFGEGTVVVSGAEQKQGSIVEPGDQTFLGFQSKAYEHRVGLNSVVINSTIFPTALASRLRFDYRLRFGSEEVDLATRMVAAGATIVYCPEAVNVHMTSPRGRSSYALEATTSRLYVTFKRYAFTQRRPLLACAYLLIAPLHTTLAGMRRKSPIGVIGSLRAVFAAGRYTLSFLSERARSDRQS